MISFPLKITEYETSLSAEIKTLIFLSGEEISKSSARTCGKTIRVRKKDKKNIFIVYPIELS